jgi:hypothetical protein
MAGPSGNTAISFEPNKLPETPITFSNTQPKQSVAQPDAPMLVPTQFTKQRGPSRANIYKIENFFRKSGVLGQKSAPVHMNFRATRK